jgi:aspartate racemase
MPYIQQKWKIVTKAAFAEAHSWRRLPAICCGHSLIRREKLDGIVLAGTDLAFVFNPTNTDFPHVDGARVHVEAIMREIAGKPRTPTGC